MSVLKILCVLLISTATVYADWENEFTSKPFLIAENITIDQAAKKLQERVGGRVLGAKSIEKDGKTYYVFKVLTEEDGRVRLIKVDSATGQSVEKN